MRRTPQAGEMRMGAAKKRKIEVRHYIIGIAVFVVAVAVSLIIFFLGIQSDDS